MAYPISPTPAQCTINPCLTGCPEVTPRGELPYTECEYLCNIRFECPVITIPVERVNKDLIPCWETNHPTNSIEIWNGTGIGGPLPHSGNQYIKLPAGTPISPNKKVYQNANLPFGVPLVISFWHAGRVGYLNNMTVSLGNQTLFPLVQAVDDLTPIVLGSFTAIDNVWTQHVINITLPAGFTSIYALVFESNDSGLGGNFIDDVSISRPVPALTASSNSPISLGGTINLAASTIPTYTYSWVGPDSFTSNLQNPVIPNATALKGGIYTVTASPLAGEVGCPAVSSTTVVILPCDLSITASSNSSVTIGNTLNLTSISSNGTAPYTFLWTGPNGFSSALQNPSFITTSLLETGSYTVQVTDANNCMALADIDVDIVPPPCFLITDCNLINPQPPVTTSTDLIAYNGKIVRFCDSISTWAPGCYCATITRILGCTVTTPLPNFIVNITGSFDNCITCNPYCYLLTDCSDPSNTILVSNDFVNYIGLVVKLEGCSTCWEVSQLTNCTGTVCADSVVTSFNTCLECLPPVLPIPKEELQLRSVKPGYNTPGCSPQYTEKINCNFAEAAYDQMAVTRYGIQVCCDLDLDNLDIKKQELDLRAIFDPELCKTIVPECTTCDDCPPIIVTPGTCTTDLECTNGQVCINGLCVDPVLPPTSCTSDNDCTGGQICQAGVCVDPT